MANTYCESARKAKELLRQRLLSQKDFDTGVLEGRREALSTVRELLERTVVNGEGNSLLIIGSQGCGKSWVIEQALKSLESNAKCKNNFITVKLNGLVHTNDRQALLEIAKRLHTDLEQGDKLSLSFAAALTYLLEALKSGNQSNQSVVFVLDHFDLFTHHKNQTLLYNLFDAAQSGHTPIAVIGLTCRLDVVELLEKRVKSRFSHRQINLFCDYSFEDYVEAFKSFLSLPADFSDGEYRQKWEKQIEELSLNAKVRAALKSQYDTFPDIGSLKSFLTLPVCKLGLRASFLRPSDFSEAILLQNHEPKAAMLHGVSVLELCLVIAMKNISEISEGEPFNFEMVYNEYKKFTQRTHSVEFFSKPVALKAFEHLMDLEFVCPMDSGGSGKVQKEYQQMVLMLEEEQISQAVRKYDNCPTDVERWGSSKGMA